MTKERFKRGAKVKVVLKGVVLNPIYEGETLSGYRVTVKKPTQDKSWWAVVPANAVKER